MIKVSIIVPVYNVEEYLNKCLDSLFSQKFDSFEIICVNDCSTDSSLDILHSYSQKYTNCHVLNNETNRGLSYSRNRGIKEAKGEYLLFVDSDDWLINNSVLYDLFSKASELEVDLLRFGISTDTRIVDEDLVGEGKKVFSALIGQEKYKWESVRNFVRRSSLVNNKVLFDEKIYGCEDILFSTLCLWRIDRCAEIPDIFYYYNRRNGSITKSRITSERVEGALLVIDALYEIYGNNLHDNAKYAVLNLISRVSVMCEYLLFNLNESLNYQGWSNSVYLLYENLFRNGKLINNHILFTNWDRLMSASRIYLYGAGKACEEFIDITNQRINFSGIIVSKKSNDISLFNNLTVFEVSDAQIDRSSLIIVCITGKERQQEVRKTLEMNEYENVIVAAKE